MSATDIAGVASPHRDIAIIDEKNFVNGGVLVAEDASEIKLFPIPHEDYFIILSIALGPAGRNDSDISVEDGIVKLKIYRPATMNVKSAHWNLGIARNENRLYYVNLTIHTVGSPENFVLEIAYSVFWRLA